MRLLKGSIALFLFICIVGFGFACAEQAEASSSAGSGWIADPAACIPVTLDNVTALTQLVQIGKGEPHTAAWSPDGTMVALATGTGVHLFDGYTMELLAALQSGYTTKMAWSQDGTLLALCSSASAGDEIQVWDVTSMEKKYSITQKRSIEDLYIDQKNNSLVALGQQQSGNGQYNEPLYKAFLDVYNLKTGKKKDDSVAFVAEDKGLMNLSLSNNGGIVFGAGLKKCYIWHAKGKLFYSGSIVMPMNAFSVSDASISVILDLMKSNSIQIIDRKTGKKTSDVALPKRVKEMELNEETQELILYTSKGYVVYNLETQEITADVSFYKNFGGTVFLSPDRSRVFQIYGAELRLVDLTAETQLGVQIGYEARAEQVAVSNDRLAASKGSSYNNDTQLLLWDLNTLASIAVIKGKECSEDISDVFFTPDGSELITYDWGEANLNIWNAADGSRSRDISLDADIYSANLSADGSTIAIGHGGFAGYLPFTGTGSENTFYVESFVSSVSLSENGDKIAACDGTFLVVWDAVAQTELFYIGDEALGAAVICDDGEKVAALYSGQDGYIVKMVDANTGKILWTHKISDKYCDMCFSPDGSMLAISAYQDGLIFLNADTGKEIFPLQYTVSDFSFSKDGRFIVTASSDGTIRLWGIIE